eukprot:TRINITY_DN7954_c0_g1_i3.p1 TRINITY_DN7954_c0_g1~~TRINITY_DN7954_c0_g1_i3.p1  ORF type:complete len:560 (+),score=103.78 TRINITY_DN7954_c0_g1_i3:125-1804(+)
MSVKLNKAEAKLELRQASKQLTDRGLYHAAQWAAELLCAIEEVQQTPENYKLPNCLVDENQDQDLLLLAMTYFELKEYYRTAHVLRQCVGNKARFLRGYSLYLAGEKRKEEELLEVSEGRPVINRELRSLKEQLQGLYKSQQLDGFCLYLFGIVLRELDMKAQARKVLLQSVNVYPWNWSAWQDLGLLCTSREMVDKLNISTHWMLEFFHGFVMLEFQQNQQSLKVYDSLVQSLPNSNYLLAQSATAHYNLKEFEEAQHLFEQLLSQDPYRLTNMDTYSNILYVKESSTRLSYLAYKASTTDKYTPETCCIIGNYYSLKSEHEKAVLYFKRALKLNRRYLSAWTLMGHEYLEMKNTAAAIEAYRKAVDINPRDYRAWYGLGQTYEILTMPLYALYYYRKATALRPYDGRMWTAMAGCYKSLGNLQDALKCYLRANSNKDREAVSLNELAQLYHQLGNDDKAAAYYQKHLAETEGEGEGQDSIAALLFLAQHHKNIGNLRMAEAYASRLLDFSGKEKEEAKAILREIHSTQNYKAGSSLNVSIDMSIDKSVSDIELDDNN